MRLFGKNWFEWPKKPKPAASPQQRQDETGAAIQSFTDKKRAENQRLLDEANQRLDDLR